MGGDVLRADLRGILYEAGGTGPEKPQGVPGDSAVAGAILSESTQSEPAFSSPHAKFRGNVLKILQTRRTGN